MTRRTRLAVAGHTAIFAVLIGSAVAIHAAWPDRQVPDPPATDTATQQSSGGEGPAMPGSGAEPRPPALAAVHLAPPIIGGRATWYRAHGMIAAAGPALRGYISPRWRGSLVSVCAVATGQCVVVRLSDWCLCTGHGGRLIDLSDDAFAQLAPLSAGVVGVEITRVVAPRPPATDASARNDP